MGLDAVEIVLRTEELFVIVIDDDDAVAARTVGDFYKLICSKVNVVPLPSPVTSEMLPVITQKDKQFLFLYKHIPLPPPPEVLPWSPQSVWDCMVAIFVDQQGLKPEEIRLPSPDQPRSWHRLNPSDLTSGIHEWSLARCAFRATSSVTTRRRAPARRGRT